VPILYTMWPKQAKKQPCCHMVQSENSRAAWQTKNPKNHKMSNQQTLSVDTLHPGRMRSQSNSGDGMTLNPSAVAATQQLETELQVIAKIEDSHVDLYPNASREIENHGDTLHRNALHKLEAEKPQLPALSPKLSGVATSDLYPAVKANNLGTSFETHAADAKEAAARLGGPPQLDLYPPILANNTGLEQTLAQAARK